MVMTWFKIKRFISNRIKAAGFWYSIHHRIWPTIKTIAFGPLTRCHDFWCSTATVGTGGLYWKKIIDIHSCTKLFVDINRETYYLWSPVLDRIRDKHWCEMFNELHECGQAYLMRDDYRPTVPVKIEAFSKGTF